MPSLRALASVACLSSLLGCASTRPPALGEGTAPAAPSATVPAAATAEPGRTPAPEPLAASPAFPRIEIGWSNPSADEPDTATYQLRADGAFAKKIHRSNGGGGWSEEVCVGEMPPAEASAWLTKVRAAATLREAPRLPAHSYEAGFAEVNAYRVRLLTGPDATAYGDPRAAMPALAPLVERMARGGRCTSSRHGR